MGVDWLSCKKCGETFPDCGDFVYCEECGNYWCSDECAQEDGYIDEHCEKYDSSGLYDISDVREEHDCDEEFCENCDYYTAVSCKYCRKEDFDDSDLLKYVLIKLKKTREEIIEEYKHIMELIGND